MGELDGRVAIVTGASLPGGIGLSIARRFAAAGATLFLAAEGPEAQLEANRAACAGIAGAGPVACGLFDLSVEGAAEAMVGHVVDRFGRLDILVNNAAMRVNKDFGDYSRQDFAQVVGVNLAAPFFASQAALPTMRRQGGGRIINVASQLAKVALPQRALYGLTKAALVHLTRSMACEVGRDGIMVNAISPGPTQTARALERERADPALARRLVSQIPLGRAGRPDEIAEIAFFLATTTCEFLQGEDICADGGYTAQ